VTARELVVDSEEGSKWMSEPRVFADRCNCATMRMQGVTV
jgi:hypothetical protein